MPVYLKDARVQIGPEMRRGIAEFNGEEAKWPAAWFAAFR